MHGRKIATFLTSATLLAVVSAGMAGATDDSKGAFFIYSGVKTKHHRVCVRLLGPKDKEQPFYVITGYPAVIPLPGHPDIQYSTIPNSEWLTVNTDGKGDAANAVAGAIYTWKIYFESRHKIIKDIDGQVLSDNELQNVVVDGKPKTFSRPTTTNPSWKNPPYTFDADNNKGYEIDKWYECVCGFKPCDKHGHKLYAHKVVLKVYNHGPQYHEGYNPSSVDFCFRVDPNSDNDGDD
jgi:hypothetical protein